MGKIALIFDVETDGLPQWDQPADADGQPRLCSIAAALVNDRGLEYERFTSLIKPEGWEFDDDCEAAKINGLTSAQLHEEGRPVLDVLEQFDAMVDKCGFIAAFSIRFDQKMIRAEQRRAGRPDRYGERDTFEIMYPARKLACSTGGAHSNPRKLTECWENIFGASREHEHEAGADLDATIAIYRRLLLEGQVEPKPQVSKKEGEA